MSGTATATRKPADTGDDPAVLAERTRRASRVKDTPPPPAAPEPEAPEAEERAVEVGKVVIVADGDNAHRILIGRSRKVKPLWVSRTEALAMRDALVLEFGATSGVNAP